MQFRKLGRPRMIWKKTYGKDLGVIDFRWSESQHSWHEIIKSSEAAPP